MLAVSTAACGGGQGEKASEAPVAEQTKAKETESEAKKELTKVTLSAQPAPHSLPIFAALQKGWFEEEGLDVEVLTYISGPPQMEAVPSDAWQMGISGIAATVTGVVGYDLTVCGFSVWDHPSQRLFARPDSPIVTAGKGKVEGHPEIYGTADDYRGIDILCTKGTLGHLQLLATLKALGLTEDDVNIIHMEIPAAYQAFKAGEADAFVTWSTFTQQAQEEGWVEVSSAEKAGLLVPSAILANETVINNDPETVQKLMNVIFRGIMWVNDNKEEAAKLYYDVCMEEGVNATEEFCKITMDEHSAPTLEEMEEMLENGGFEKNLENVMSFYMEQGTYTEVEKKKVIDSFDGQYLKNAMESYKKLEK